MLTLRRNTHLIDLDRLRKCHRMTVMENIIKSYIPDYIGTWGDYATDGTWPRCLELTQCNKFSGE